MRVPKEEEDIAPERKNIDFGSDLCRCSLRVDIRYETSVPERILVDI